MFVHSQSNVNVAENTVAIVLAAGKSKRLGEPKALLNCGNQTLIEFIVKRLESIELKVIVVTNSVLEKSIKKSLSFTKATVLIPKNTNYRTGNVIAGLNICNNPGKILVVPVDRPGWSLNTIKHLIKNNETSCPEYEGKGGHPLLICKQDLEILKKSPKDSPLNSLFSTKKINVNDPHIHLNIDTQDDIKLLNHFIDEFES